MCSFTTGHFCMCVICAKTYSFTLILGSVLSDFVVFYGNVTAIRPVLEYRAPVWHNALTKAQSESLKAVQKRVNHIIYNSTRGMPYLGLAVLCKSEFAGFSKRRSLSWFFMDIMDRVSCFHTVLPPLRSTAITSRPRSSQTFYTSNQRYWSFIQYGLNHYQ